MIILSLNMYISMSVISLCNCSISPCFSTFLEQSPLHRKGTSINLKSTLYVIEIYTHLSNAKKTPSPFNTGLASFLFCMALFTSQKILQNFSHFSSHRIFRRIYGVLNIDENKNQLHNLVEIDETNLLSLVSA